MRITPKSIIVGIILAAVAFGLIVINRTALLQPVFRCFYKDQIALVSGFITAARASDGSKVSAMLTPDVPPFRGKQDGVERAGALIRSADPRTMKILGVYTDSLNGRSYCLIHVDFENDIRKELGFRLIKDGQRWLIDGVSLLSGE